MLEITMDAMGTPEVEAPSEEMLKAGMAPQVHMRIMSGQIIPIPGTQQAMRVPQMVANFALGKKEALEYAKAIKEAAEVLPSESTLPKDFTVASSLDDVEKVAQMQGALRG